MKNYNPSMGIAIGSTLLGLGLGIAIGVISTLNPYIGGRQISNIKCQANEAIYYSPNPPYDFGCFQVEDLKNAK